MMRQLCVVEKATGEVVEAIDITHETESGVRQIRTGIRMQMNHDDYRLEERESE